jgi:ABC-type sulfate/molybdate transport systems ATPase subunit
MLDQHPLLGIDGDVALGRLGRPGSNEIEVRGLLASSIREMAIPTLVVTHDCGDILALAGRVAVMEAGCIVACLGVDEARTAPVNAFVAKLFAQAGPAPGSILV